MNAQDIRRNLNVHETFARRPERLLNVQFTACSQGEILWNKIRYNHGLDEIICNGEIMLYKPVTSYGDGLMCHSSAVSVQMQPLEVFCKKRCQRPEPAILFKKRLWQRGFSVNFVKVFRSSFFREHFQATASVCTKIIGFGIIQFSIIVQLIAKKGLMEIFSQVPLHDVNVVIMGLTTVYKFGK